jgi:hypothetical protein
MTLWPAKVVVELGQLEAGFTVLNGGSQAQHIVVSSSDGWLAPAEASFDLAVGERHTTQAKILVPRVHDDGDHDTRITFGVLSTGNAQSSVATGPIRIIRALAATVIVATGGKIRHGLSLDSLQLPRFVDPMHGPVRLTVRAVNAGNVHEVVQPVGTLGGQRVAFEPAILSRDSSRVLGADWSPPALCLCEARVGALRATVIVFPVRLVGLILALLVLLRAIALLPVMRARR